MSSARFYLLFLAAVLVAFAAGAILPAAYRAEHTYAKETR